MNFRFAPGAQLDLFDLVDWYDAQHAGSGTRFAAAFQALIVQLLANPRAYGRVARAPRNREVREAPVPGFLVVVTYEVTTTEVIILAVTHARAARRPWRRRLPDPPTP
jgi:plasmid stabilization system protein ParE